MSESAGKRPDLWARVWLSLGSDRLLIVWLGLLAFTGLVIVWFPQAPRSAFLQDGMLESWLTDVRTELGPPTDLLLAIGFLTVERAGWFRLIVAATTVSLIVRAVDSLARLVTPGWSIAEPHLAQRLTLPVPVSVALDKVRRYAAADLREFDSQPGQIHRLAARQQLAPLGPLCISLGGVLIAAGWLWTQVAGWQAGDLYLTTQTPATLAFAGGTLTLEDLDVEWQDGATARRARGQLQLARDQTVNSGGISLDSPWHWQGATYDLTSVGPAIHVSGSEPDGEPLLLQVAASRPPAEQITVVLPADDNLRSFAAPEQGIVVQVEAVAGELSPEIRLRVYLGQAGELIEDRVMDAQAFVLINGSRLSLSLIPFAEITVTYSPGRPLGIGGAVLSLAGVVLALVYPRQELWVEVESEEDRSVVTLVTSGGKQSQRLAALSQSLVRNEREGDEG